MPAYNSEIFLERTLLSVLGQTYSNWVCVVVDDGSQDGTGALAEHLAERDERLSVRRQRNSGVSAARNAGAAALPNVDALLFLDADDMLLRNGLQLLVEALNAAPGASAAVGGLTVVDRDDNVTGSIAQTVSILDLASIAEINPCPAPCGFLLRRTAFLHAGGFPLDYACMEDWYLFTLIARAGPMVCVPLPVAAYRRHIGSVTASEAFSRAVPREARRLRSDIYRNSWNEDVDRRAFRAAWRRHHSKKARQQAEGRNFKRMLGHLALAVVGRPFDLSRLRVGWSGFRRAPAESCAGATEV